MQGKKKREEKYIERKKEKIQINFTKLFFLRPQIN